MTTSLATKPKVGDGATQSVGSDCYPFTIIEVSPSGKTLTLQRDDAHRIDRNGLSEDQRYIYTRATSGALRTARWSEKRQRYLVDGRPVSVGVRRYYQDPSF